MAMFPCDALADTVFLDDVQWPYVLYGDGADFSTLTSWKGDSKWTTQSFFNNEDEQYQGHDYGRVYSPVVRAYIPSTGVTYNPEGYTYLGMSFYAGQGNRIVRQGQKLKLIPVGSTIGYCATADANPVFVDARVGFYRIWVKNSGEQVIQITPDEDGNFTIPQDSQFLVLSFRVDWPSRLGNYIVMNMPRILLVEESDSYVTQTQTDSLKDTTGYDQIVDQNNVGQMTEDIQSMSVFESLTEIGDTLKEAVTTTDQNPVVVFPGMSFQGFQLPSANINVWQHCPIDQSVIRGFITFVFVVWYIRHMYALIEQIFGLRFYGWSESDIPVEAGRWTGADNDNWGLV